MTPIARPERNPKDTTERAFTLLLAFFLTAVAVGETHAQVESTDESALTMIVMDPLCTPLSCPCVEGYAQRDYQQLARFIEKQLQQPVRVFFDPSLTSAFKGDAKGEFDIVIGKKSVIESDARANQLQLTAVGKLTDSTGSTKQLGLIVVPQNDLATTISDLKEHRFFLGPDDCDEKYKAVHELFERNAVSLMVGEKTETCSACSDGATRVLELHDQSIPAATVISSYAAPLLEGCGTVPPNSLRVIAKTEPVPFVTAFVADKLPQATKAEITRALLDVGDDARLCVALESLAGFLPMDEADPVIDEAGEFSLAPARLPDDSAPSSHVTASDELIDEECGWCGWRGNRRNGLVSRLPEQPSTDPKRIWSTPLVHRGLGGIAATEDLVLFGDRDSDDRQDVWRCLDSYTGIQLWQVAVSAEGNYDYGNSPRATPLIHGDLAFLLGVCGDLLCVDVISGEIRWQINLRKEFGTRVELPWGYCGSPLLVSDLLIVAPGAPDASLVALKPETGDVVWRTKGPGPSYGSLIAGSFGGKEQVVGHDADSLGGWDIQTGKRLWTVRPDTPGDFNVPTPVEYRNQLLVTTENNGTRLFAFRNDGTIIPEPVAIHRSLTPNMSSPVVSGDLLFCVDRFLYCLDMKDNLKELWRLRDPCLSAYASIVASANSLLVVGDGELLFISSDGNKTLLARQTIFNERLPIYSHPAIVGNRMYLRGETSIVCLNL